VEERFGAIMAPLEARKAELLKKKKTCQFKRDVEDENLWIEEKMALASSLEVGNTLQVTRNFFFSFQITKN
jgi:hypothetical protein